MGIAILLFGLVVGIFHFQAEDVSADQRQLLAAAPAEPAGYAASAPAVPLSKSSAFSSAQTAVAATSASVGSVYESLARAESPEQLAQAVADIVTAKPGSAASVVTIALAQMFDDSTLGDVALIAATATKAAPAEGASIAAAVARSVGSHSQPALAAAVATIISLVPEQSREIGLVVGAIIGDNPTALGMVAQTVAIAVGEETFSSLAEGSGVSVASLMKESSRLGIKVPFDVPMYAAQLAPASSMVAGANNSPVSSDGDM
jgi:hypothetical protein